MSATDELRRLLDEAGVEYRFNDATKVFEWHFDGTDGEGSAHATEVDGGINIMACSITPEQAIAATLGPAARHPKPHEQWTTVLLSEIAWGWGDRWPDYLSVAHDAYGEWRVYVPEDTLGSCNCSNSERTGTCHDKNGFDPKMGFECTVCGTMVDEYMVTPMDYGHQEQFRYCPGCGRRLIRL